MNAEKKANRIKSEMDGWRKIADALSTEYSKVDRTTDIQSLLELCSGKTVDNRTVSPELQSTIKRLCIAHGVQYDSIPTGLKDAYNYANTMKKKCGADFESVKNEYAAGRVRLRKFKAGATIAVVLVAGAFAVRPIMYSVAVGHEVNKEYDKAKAIYAFLGNYKDSKEKNDSITALIDAESSQSEDATDGSTSSSMQDNADNKQLIALSEENHRIWRTKDNEAFELFKELAGGLSIESAERKYGEFDFAGSTTYDHPKEYRGVTSYKCAGLTVKGNVLEAKIAYLVRTSDLAKVFSRISWDTEYDELQIPEFEQTCYAIADTLGVECDGYDYDSYEADGYVHWQCYEAYFGDVTLTCYFENGSQNWYLKKK